MILKVKNLSKKFNNKVIFDNFNLEVNQGEFIMLKGKSGVGKSTLLNIIGLLDDEYEGDINLFGYDNPHIDFKDGRYLLKEKISYVFQNSGLVESDTIYDNLKIVCKSSSKKGKIKEIKQKLKVVNLNLELGQKVYELSGGEQQRIAIVKSMLKNAALILCDEPTGNLDHENAINILNILKQEHQKGKTIIIVSHESLVQKYVDKVIEI